MAHAAIVMLEGKRKAGKEGGGAATKKLCTLARGFLDIMLQADPIEPKASELRYVFKKVPHPIFGEETDIIFVRRIMLSGRHV